MENLKTLKFEKISDYYLIRPPYTSLINNSSNEPIKLNESDMECLIRDCLLNKNIKIEEYQDNTLIKEGYPGNWKDFTDICINDEIPPSICAIKIKDNNVDICFLKTLENVIYHCEFQDDDVYSNTYTLLEEINAYQILYDDKNFIKNFYTDKLKCEISKSKSSIEMLKSYLKVDITRVETYKRLNICNLDRSLLQDLRNIKFNTITIQGSRLLKLFLSQPLVNVEEIENRLIIVDELRNLEFPILREFPDLLRINKKIVNFKISINEIIKLYQVIRKIPELINSLNVNNQRIRVDFIDPLCNIKDNLIRLLLEIEKVIDIEKSTSHIIKFKADNENLSDLYASLDKIKSQKDEEFRRMLKFCDKIKFENNNFRITRIEYKRFERILKDNNILILSTLKSGIVFTTKNLSDYNMEEENILNQINKETSQLVNDLRKKLLNYINELEVFNYIIALLDVFKAFSEKSKLPGWSRPVFGSKLIIKEGFHPLLEDKDVITNDIGLSEVDEIKNDKMYIITGPNMGGKSTFLRMIGTISVLGQIGCYVSAKYAMLPVFDGIYLRIGANDCSHKGESSFMMEMKDISRICRMATSKSLVLIDELGRGTSEVDGISIAKAVKDYLTEVQCLTLFATHFSELCDDKCINKKALSNKSTLLYKIVDGVCDTSFGINVAEIVGFPKHVLDDIKKMMDNN